MKKRNDRKYLLPLLVLVTGILAGVGVAVNTPSAVAEEVLVYKSPTCGCCKKWVAHMRENGFKVTVREQYNVAPVKDAMGVPRPLRSCHTAKVGNYVIEGHVPADVVRKLLREKPEVAGVAVPGMPMGSPGMEGFRKDPYDVIAFTGSGGNRIYASR